MFITKIRKEKVNENMLKCERKMKLVLLYNIYICLFLRGNSFGRNLDTVKVNKINNEESLC